MIAIVFQNEHFVICNKPVGVLSVPSRDKADPRFCLGTEVQKVFKKQVFPVHRLDFEVSGLIIYALNPEAHKVSQEWFQKKQIQKKYIAITEKQNFSHWPDHIETDRSLICEVPSEIFFWKTQILRGKKRSFQSVNGDWAETKAQISRRLNDELLEWQLWPITGKSHQLRLELSRHGFPIVGDSLYGSKKSHSKSGIALVSSEIDLKLVKNTLGLPEKIIL